MGRHLPPRRHGPGRRAGHHARPRDRAGGAAYARSGRIDQASPQGEAGLLGLAVSPSYDEDGLVYAYVSTASDNRVVRMTYDGRRLGEPEPVLTGIPNGFIHDGGRLLFADDGNLFVSTGETGEPPLAQDARLARREDPAHHRGRGSPAPDNPVDGLAGVVDGAPQRAGAGVRRRRAAVGHRVRRADLGRAEPHRARAATTAGRSSRARATSRSTATRTSPGRPPTRRPPGSRSSTGRCGPAPCGASGCGRSR